MAGVTPRRPPPSGSFRLFATLSTRYVRRLHALPVANKSPRWLVQHNKSSRAKAVLSSLRSGSVAAELSAIENDAAAHTRTTRALFTDCFPRLWRAFLLQFMAQMCGATAMKYYLPSLLAALGVEYKLALMAGAVEMTAKIGLTVVEMWLIDRIGRRSCLVGGSLIMGSAMLVRSRTLAVHLLTAGQWRVAAVK